MPFGDNSMPQKLACKTLWAVNAQGLVGAAGASAALGAGNPVQGELQGDSELAGIVINAAGDEVHFLIDPKSDLWDCDFSRDIQCQVLWCSSGVVTDDLIQWIAAIKGIAAGVALSDVAVAPDGGVTFNTSLNTGGDTLQVTEKVGLGVAGDFGNVNGDPTDDLLMLLVECHSLGDAAADEIKLIGVRLWYTRKMCDTSGVRQMT